MDKTELRAFIEAKHSFAREVVSEGGSPDDPDVSYWQGKYAAYCEVMEFLKESLT